MADTKNEELTTEELQVLEGLLAKLSGPSAYLPWPLFRFITEVTATPNVDLVVWDHKKGVLLAWRDDPFAPAGTFPAVSSGTERKLHIEFRPALGRSLAVG